jgi:hypothetical protein
MDRHQRNDVVAVLLQQGFTRLDQGDEAAFLGVG